MITVLIAMLHSIACVFFIGTGLTKLVVPDSLTRPLADARLTRRASGANVARLVGAVEIAIGTGLLLSDPSGRTGRVLAAAAIAYILVASPVGIYLILTAGDCGCSGRSPDRVSSQDPNVGGLLLRNSLLMMAIVITLTFSLDARAVVGAVISIAATILLQSLTTLRSCWSAVHRLGAEIRDASPRAASQPTYYQP